MFDGIEVKQDLDGWRWRIAKDEEYSKTVHPTREMAIEDAKNAFNVIEFKDVTKPTITYPTSIKIGPHYFKIERWEHTASTTHQQYGQCSVSEKTLRVDRMLEGTWHWLETMIHEINHAVYWVYDIEDEDKEERVVAAFSTAWTSIYQDNPELVTFIRDYKQMVNNNE